MISGARCCNLSTLLPKLEMSQLPTRHLTVGMMHAYALEEELIESGTTESELSMLIHSILLLRPSLAAEAVSSELSMPAHNISSMSIHSIILLRPTLAAEAVSSEL